MMPVNRIDAFDERAAFYLSLARAFLPPREAGHCQALREHLASDLGEFAAGLDYPVAAELAQLRAGLAQLSGPLECLQVYSGLFLAPPVPAPLNAGWYLDGTVMGATTAQVEAVYRYHGLVQDDGFRDAPDHLAALLEFVAVLFARAGAAQRAGRLAERARLGEAARTFLDRFVLTWLPALCRRLEQTDRGMVPNPYAALARLLLLAAQQDVMQPAGQWCPCAPRSNVPTVDAQDGSAASKTVTCRLCAQVYLPQDALGHMSAVLHEHGLGTEHLGICPACRHRALGLKPLPAPAAGTRRVRQ